MNIDAWKTFPDEHVLIASPEHDITVGQIRNLAFSVQNQLEQADVQSCALFTADILQFVVVFQACIAADIDVVLPANNLPETISCLDVDCFIGDWGEQALSINMSTNSKLATKLKTHSSSKVTLFTSGSTGQPKSITRSVVQLFKEVEVLNQTFSQGSSQLLFVSTVSHQHIYGLLFTILWPLFKGHSIWHKLIPFEEMIDDISQLKKTWVLVSSPAFLKRIYESHHVEVSPVKVFSSGGVLTNEQHQQAEQKLSAPIIQVYGSSETGGIAHRGLHQDWQFFEEVSAKITKGQLWVKSPFCFQNDWLCTQDLIEVTDDGFKLLGRSDRIVKIEEKRISLNLIEQQAVKLDWVVDAAALVLEQGRQYIAAVFEISESGVEFIKQHGEVELKKTIKAALSQSIDKIALPRKIRFTTAPLVNAQGKKVKAELLKLFI